MTQQRCCHSLLLQHCRALASLLLILLLFCRRLLGTGILAVVLQAALHNQQHPGGCIPETKMSQHHRHLLPCCSCSDKLGLP